MDSEKIENEEDSQSVNPRSGSGFLALKIKREMP